VRTISGAFCAILQYSSSTLEKVVIMDACGVVEKWTIEAAARRHRNNTFVPAALFIYYIFHPFIFSTIFSYCMRAKWFDPYDIKKKNGVVCWDLIVEGY
jgi:hypothetical protein